MVKSLTASEWFSALAVSVWGWVQLVSSDWSVLGVLESYPD